MSDEQQPDSKDAKDADDETDKKDATDAGDATGAADASNANVAEDSDAENDAAAAKDQRRMERVRNLFLSCAGGIYPKFDDEEAMRHASEWFAQDFEWDEEYGDDMAAASDMVAKWMSILASNVSSEEQKALAAEANKSPRKIPKRPAEQSEPSPASGKATARGKAPRCKQPKKPKQSPGGSTSGGGGSSSTEPVSPVPVPGHATDAASVIFALIQAIAAMSDEERRALLEKLQRP